MHLTRPIVVSQHECRPRSICRNDMRSPSDTELASSCVSSAREASLTGVARCRGITGGQRGQLLPPGSAGKGAKDSLAKIFDD